MNNMKCRPHCGACCIAPSIVNPYFGMPNGKKAGEMCVHLNRATWGCGIWGSEVYPSACRNFAAAEEFCGATREEAIKILAEVEELTRPSC